jgi:tyrosine-protein phosphatase SIW14
MPRWLQFVFAALVAALLVGGPLAYAQYKHTHLRNFHVVRDGVLYRSGQLSPDGLQRVINEYRIKTIVTLRWAYQADKRPPDIKEEEYCHKEGYNYIRMPQKNWFGENGSVPNEENVVKWRDIMNDPANYPVLVHCFGGTHRTGAMCAVFRMEHDHWSNEQAIEEMKWYGYDNIQEELDILGYLSTYRATWLGPVLK